MKKKLLAGLICAAAICVGVAASACGGSGGASSGIQKPSVPAGVKLTSVEENKMLEKSRSISSAMQTATDCTLQSYGIRTTQSTVTVNGAKKSKTEESETSFSANYLAGDKNRGSISYCVRASRNGFDGYDIDHNERELDSKYERGVESNLNGGAVQVLASYKEEEKGTVKVDTKPGPAFNYLSNKNMSISEFYYASNSGNMDIYPVYPGELIEDYLRYKNPKNDGIGYLPNDLDYEYIEWILAQGGTYKVDKYNVSLKANDDSMFFEYERVYTVDYKNENNAKEVVTSKYSVYASKAAGCKAGDFKEGIFTNENTKDFAYFDCDITAAAAAINAGNSYEVTLMGTLNDGLKISAGNKRVTKEELQAAGNKCAISKDNMYDMSEYGEGDYYLLHFSEAIGNTAESNLVRTIIRIYK